MTVYGIAAMFIFFLTFASTKEVVPPTVSQAHTSLKEDFKGLTGQVWILFLLNLFCFSLYVVRSTTVIYYFKYNLGRTEWLSLVGVLGILSGLPMLLALPALEKKYSRKSLMFVSVALYVAGDLLIFAGRNSGGLPAGGADCGVSGILCKRRHGADQFYHRQIPEARRLCGKCRPDREGAVLHRDLLYLDSDHPVCTDRSSCLFL